MVMMMNCISSEIIMLKSSYMLIFTFPWEKLTFSLLLDMQEEPEDDVCFDLLFYYMLHFSCVLVHVIASLYIAPYFI